MATGPRISVMVVDDHPVMRAATRRFLDDRDGMTVVHEADSIDGALAFAPGEVDVIVLDLSMPGTSGLDGTPMLLSRSGYTGEVGFEIFVGDQGDPEFWSAFFAKVGDLAFDRFHARSSLTFGLLRLFLECFAFDLETCDLTMRLFKLWRLILEGKSQCGCGLVYEVYRFVRKESLGDVPR